MTSVSPPTYYFDGITFNSAFYTTSSSGGLTQAQANALYLKKNSADTATALETFTGGVITNSIDTSTLASNMTIGKATNTGTITIGTIGAMNLGVVSAPLNTQKSVNINGTDDSGGRQYITNLSNFKFRTGTGFNELNLFDSNSSNYFAIGDRQVSGELRLGGGASVPRSGAITIGTNASNTCNVNISNAPGTALLPTSGAVNIASGSNGIATSYTVSTNIGAGSTSGLVTIGNPSNGVTIGSGLSTSICNQVGMINAVNILSGGGATTGGSVNIANGATQSTTVNIASGSGTGTVTIGGVSNTVQINGALTMGTGKNITLAPSTSYVAPTALTMLGGRSVGTVSTSLSGISNVVSSIRLTMAGVYIISWSYQISYTTRPTYFFSNVATGLTALVTGPVTYGNSNYGYSDMGLFESLNRTTTSGSQVVVATLDNYYNLVIFISGGAFTGVGGFYNIVRIA